MIILENLDVSRVPGVLLGTHLNINLEFSRGQLLVARPRDVVQYSQVVLLEISSK